MAAHEHLQQQLFDPATTRARDKGEVPFHEWLDQPNVAYHGTFNPDWEQAPYHHFGDVKAAATRLGNVTSTVKSPATRNAYYSGEQMSDDFDDSDYEPEPQTHTGRVFARKLDLVRQNEPLSDPVANASQVHAMLQEGHDPWEIPQSVAESQGGMVSHGLEGPTVDRRERDAGKVKAGSRALRMGKGLTYLNNIEPGETGVSHVASRFGQSTWEEDVLNSKHSSTMARGYARERVRKGEASSVPFEDPQGTSKRTWQPTLSGRDAGKPGPKNIQHISKIQFTTED